MRVLLVGNGGREHAIAWTLSQSERIERIYVAPGNGGTARQAKAENVPLSVSDLDGLCDFAVEQRVDLTIVGPEAPLTEGIVDRFLAAGMRIFGPTQAAAQLEGSKAFSKEFMQKYDIPTGRAGIFTDFDEATRYLREVEGVPVIKASGLAAGKGVILPDTREGAASVLQAMMLDRRFGKAGATVLIEERLEGPELSVLAFCDGQSLRVMPAAQDHKRLMNGDRGPNTGGMGAFAPSALATTELLAQVEASVLRPTVDGMASEGMPYSGVLYAGLMLTQNGPKVLEYNCRFGDPEAQVILPLLESDLVEILDACVDGSLAGVEPRWRHDAAVTVVMASRGYPNKYTTGVEITRIAQAEKSGCTVFHAGTTIKADRLLTAGGRVLAVTALGDTLADAAAHAYGGVREIKFNEAHYRTDIGRE